ncbi:hypothetical protein FGIG_09214 [Fasciola gigantica]|uniref:Uncharacterized protein n=1 Tax=Fasciola gigantica TaxID=46835 RepID=A0A504YY36_FASGI|nr:hypothetical protein FGIG_09214 [Fasciola gigantica]
MTANGSTTVLVPVFSRTYSVDPNWKPPTAKKIWFRKALCPNLSDFRRTATGRRRTRLGDCDLLAGVLEPKPELWGDTIESGAEGGCRRFSGDTGAVCFKLTKGNDRATLDDQSITPTKCCLVMRVTGSHPNTDRNPDNYDLGNAEGDQTSNCGQAAWDVVGDDFLSSIGRNRLTHA